MCVCVGGVESLLLLLLLPLLLLLGAAAQFQFLPLPSGAARKSAHHIKMDTASNMFFSPFSR